MINDFCVVSDRGVFAKTMYRALVGLVGCVFIYISIFETFYSCVEAFGIMSLLAAVFFWAFPQVGTYSLDNKTLTQGVNKIAIYLAFFYVPLIILAGVYVESDEFVSIVDEVLKYTGFYDENRIEMFSESRNKYGDPGYLDAFVVLDFFMRSVFVMCAASSFIGFLFGCKKYCSVLLGSGLGQEKLGRGFFVSVVVGLFVFLLVCFEIYISPAIIIEYQDGFIFSFYYIAFGFLGVLYFVALFSFQSFLFNLILRGMVLGVRIKNRFFG